MSDISATLQGLRDGTVTTDDAAAQFGARQWPVRLAHQPPAYPGDQDADGSFGEVQAAYAAGWITDGQFALLAQAAAGATSDDDDEWETGQAGQEDLFAGESKGLPPLDPGSYVKTPDGGRGRITAVNNGTATVSVWKNNGKGWADTGTKTTVPVAQLTRTPPPMPRASSAAPAGGEAKDAEHLVYERGVMAYPGQTKTAMTPHDWATGRVEAFRSKRAGLEVPGYTRDDDLL